MIVYVIAGLAAIAVFLLLKAVITLLIPDAVELKKEESANDSELLARKLGISIDKYIFDCHIADTEPQIGKIIACKLIGMACSVIALPLLLINPVISIILLVAGIFLSVTPTQKVSGIAKDRQRELEDSLPRFFDLLYTALKINMPIVQAIEQTASCMDGILSRELLASLAEVKMGTSSWQNSLYKLAQKYEIEEFSDFVLDVTTAYEKGISITDLVERKSREIKQSSVFKAKERAAKLSSTIIFPVFALELVPVFVILFIPILLQIINGF